MVKKELKKLDSQNSRWNRIFSSMLDEVFNIENVLILAFETTYREDTDTEGINIFYVNKDDYIGIESIFIPYGQIANYKILYYDVKE